MSDITQALFGSAQSMQVVRCVFERFLHRRLAERSETTNAVWARSGHWGWCGQNCPCCRYQAGDVLGYCEACYDAVRLLRVVCVIESFIGVEPPKRDTAARLAAIFGRRGRTLPVSVIAQFIDMLPGSLKRLCTNLAPTLWKPRSHQSGVVFPDANARREGLYVVCMALKQITDSKLVRGVSVYKAKRIFEMLQLACYGGVADLYMQPSDLRVLHAVYPLPTNSASWTRYSNVQTLDASLRSFASGRSRCQGRSSILRRNGRVTGHLPNFVVSHTTY